MKCRDLEELLSAYADGELSRTQREFIEEHLAGCADCRAKLAEFTSVGRKLSSLRQTPKPPDIKETTMSKIKASGASPDKLYRPWLRPAMAIGAAVIIIALLLAGQPWVTQSPEALAASIVRNSPEVREALDDEEIREVEVTTSVVDEEGNVLMMLVRTEERTVATSVDLDTRRVTEVVRVSVPDFQPGDEQRALDIARADPGVRDLLAQGGIIEGIRLSHSLDIYQFTGPEGVAQKEGEATPIATVSIDVKGKAWYATVDLNAGEVMGLAKPAAVMTLVHISEFVSTIAAPVLLVLAALLILGLAYNDRAARAAAGISSLVLGIIGLFIGLYAMSSIWWRLVIIVGVPAAGLIIGIADLRQKTTKRWISITGIVFCALALAWVLFDAVMVPDGNAGTVTGVALVIAGIIVYALYEQIRKIPRKCWRPALMVGVAVAVLVLALVQPWSGSLEPQSVLAKTYTATEGLLSYRATMSSNVGTSDAVMEFVFPDRFHARLTAGVETDEFIVIGDRQYVKSGDMSKNMIIAFSNSASAMLSKEMTLRLIDSLTDLETLPDEKIEGVNSFHYKGRFDTERMIEKEKARLSGMQSRMDADDYERMMEGLENSLNVNMESELWIGKDDNLIRQMVQTTQFPDDEGQLQTTSTTMMFYDFNEPIIIEPPLGSDGELLEGWQLAGSITPDSTQPVFSRNFTSSIGAQEGYDDYAHQEVEYSITITNNSIETVKDVRITIATMLTDAIVKPATVEAEPKTPADTIAPDESRTYHARCPFDATNYAKEEIIKLHDMATILVHFTTEDGRELTELFYPDAPYPTKTPPPTPPAD